MGKFIDLTGHRFWRLTVVSRDENASGGRVRWNCMCDCGGTTTATALNIKNGNTKSCWVYKKRKWSHIRRVKSH